MLYLYRDLVLHCDQYSHYVVSVCYVMINVTYRLSSEWVTVKYELGWLSVALPRPQKP